MSDFFVPFYSLKFQHESIKEEIFSAISKVYDSHWLIMGESLHSFEEQYAALSKSKYCCGVGNGLDALTISLKVLGIGVGDEVIVPSNTYIATWLAVTNTGATIIPVEPNPITYNIDPRKIEPAITAKTKVILPVHLFGQACEMNEIMLLAERHGLFIVEDNAQAHGASCHNRITGSFGHCNATSFYPGKNLGAMGDAGAITTNSIDIYNHVLRLRNYGSPKKYHNEEIGMNSRLDEMQAAILKVKLKYLFAWTEMRLSIAEAYKNELTGVGDLILPVTADHCSHVYHLFVIRTKKRDQLQKYLDENHIQTLIHYPVPPHMQKAYSSLNFEASSFPLAKELAETSLSLPIWPGMDESLVTRVIEVVKGFYA